MAITTMATITQKTHEALMLYREDVEAAGENLTIPMAAGALISDALHMAGYMSRPEHVKANTAQAKNNGL